MHSEYVPDWRANSANDPPNLAMIVTFFDMFALRAPISYGRVGRCKTR